MQGDMGSIPGLGRSYITAHLLEKLTSAKQDPAQPKKTNKNS